MAHARTDASITHLLHQVSKGSTVLIQDTDRSGERIMTDLKLTAPWIQVEGQ